jgi:hypothetical protein
MEVREPQLRRIVSKAIKYKNEGLPIPDYMLDFESLANLYPANENGIHTISRFVAEAVYMGGQVDPQAHIFVNEATFNRMQMMANDLGSRPMGDSVSRSLLTIDAADRIIPGMFREGSERHNIRVSKAEIDSLATAYKDVFAPTYLPKTRKNLNIPKNLGEGFIRAVKNTYQKYAKKTKYLKDVGDTLSEMFIVKEKYEGVNVRIAEELKTLEKAYAGLGGRMIDEYKMLLDEKDARYNTQEGLIAIVEKAKDLIPSVPVDQLQFLFHIHDELLGPSGFFGAKSEDASINQKTPYKSRAKDLGTFLDANKLDAISTVLGLDQFEVRSDIEFLRLQAMKLKQDKGYLIKMSKTGDGFNDIFNSLYAVQIAIDKKMGQFKRQADIISVSLQKHVPGLINPHSGGRVNLNQLKRFYTAFYSGNILPPAINPKQKLPAFRDALDWTSKTSIPLTVQNVVRYLQDQGVASYTYTDSALQYHIDNKLKKDNTGLKLPTEKTQDTPEGQQALIEIVNHMTGPTSIHQFSLMSMVDELGVQSMFDVQSVDGKPVRIDTDPRKIMLI